MYSTKRGGRGFSFEKQKLGYGSLHKYSEKMPTFLKYGL